MFDMFAALASQLLPNQVVLDNERPTCVKIRIPRDHPKLPEFMKLAEFFATTSRTEGGVEIVRPGVVSPEVAEREMLAALSEIVGPTIVRQAVERLREEATMRNPMTFQDCARLAADIMGGNR